jgi:hypothetical protein
MNSHGLLWLSLYRFRTQFLDCRLADIVDVESLVVVEEVVISEFALSEYTGNDARSCIISKHIGQLIAE